MRLIIAFLLVMLSATVNAAEINFVKNMTWKQVVELARKQNKMIFFDAYASWCGPCKYMERSVYVNEAVAAYYNSNFINVKMDMEVGEGVKLSEMFGIAAYPTLLFFDASGKMLHKYVGAMESEQFIQLGKDAKDPASQYYTLKEKVKNNTISDADFLKWASIAKKVYDDELDNYIRLFFTMKKDILLNEYTAKLALKYADNLTDDEMFYLINNQSKISSLLSIDARAAWRMVYDKLFAMGAKAYNEDKDEEDFRAVFHKYLPASETFAMNDLSIRIAIFIDENTRKAAGLLAKYISEGSLDLREAGEIFMENAEHFNADDFGTIINKLSGFKATGTNSSTEGYLHLIYALCYAGLEQTDSGKPYAVKVVADKSLPEEYRIVVKTIYAL